MRLRQEASVLGARVLGSVFALLSLYYGWFFASRHEPFTAIQTVILLCSAAFLFLQEKPNEVAGPWFRNWRPVAWQGWIALTVVGVVGLGVFIVMDSDSHSVSDTLNRIVPTYSLLIALIVRLWLGRGVSPANKPERK
jgi:hypothetical protein